MNEALGLHRAGFEHDDLDALLRQLVGERAAARTRADDDDDRVVAEVEFGHVCLRTILYCASPLRGGRRGARQPK